MRLPRFFSNYFDDVKGNILLFVMVFGAIGLTLVVVVLSGYTISENQASRYKKGREQAFQIAEAGVNYYRWHLAHNKEDYYDGTGGAPGPYVHEYNNKDGTVIGHFSLAITPPNETSTIVTIQSTGWLDSQPNSKRTIKVRLGFPSFVDYIFLSNYPTWITDTMVLHGKIHSNSGIKFDSVAEAPITSAVATYTCKAAIGNGCSKTIKPGIWGSGGPQTYWSFPTPAEDFSVITPYLAKVKVAAQASGIYLPSSGAYGWHLSFTSLGQIIVEKVTKVKCYKGRDSEVKHKTNICIDAITFGTPTTYAMPINGKIFVEDMVWVDGTVKGRAVIGTATGKSIIINSNIVYTAKDGSDALGLMSQKDILIPFVTPDDLVIEAALLAQTGAAKRSDYEHGNGDRRNSLTIYGSLISYCSWRWNWVNRDGNIVSGFTNVEAVYDANLRYNPPPGFPVGSKYNVISWEETK